MTVCKICLGETLPYLHNMRDDRYGYRKEYDILMCKRCGLFILDPQLKEEETADLYTNYYPRQNIDAKKILSKFSAETGFAVSLKKWWGGNHRIQYLLPKGRGRILEIGCGDGRALLQLKALGYDVVGIETDRNVANIAGTLGLNVHIGTIENFGHSGQTFDYIIANQLIEHIINFDTFFAAVDKLLSPDGTIIWSTPNSGSLYRLLSPRSWINWHIPYHQQIFNKRNIITLCKKYNLQPMFIHTVTPLSWTIHQIYSWRHEPIYDTPNPHWVKTPDSSGNKTAKKLSGTRLVRSIAINSVINLFNKIPDLFGYGDCLIVGLKK